ncbi:hypothetical protein ABPG75_002006 [Micractinium tetrahymenae]
MQAALASSSSNNSSRNGGGGGGGGPARGAVGARRCGTSGPVHQLLSSMHGDDVDRPDSLLEASDESHPHPHPQPLLQQWLASSDPSTQRHAAGILAAVNLACSIATWLQPPAAAVGAPAVVGRPDGAMMPPPPLLAPALPAPALPALDSTAGPLKRARKR